MKFWICWLTIVFVIVFGVFTAGILFDKRNCNYQKKLYEPYGFTTKFDVFAGCYTIYKEK